MQRQYKYKQSIVHTSTPKKPPHTITTLKNKHKHGQYNNRISGCTSLSTSFQLYRGGGQFKWWKKTGVPGENHRTAASH
jgi:hypothetical protein